MVDIDIRRIALEIVEQLKLDVRDKQGMIAGVSLLYDKIREEVEKQSEQPEDTEPRRD